MFDHPTLIELHAEARVRELRETARPRFGARLFTLLEGHVQPVRPKAPPPVGRRREA